MLTTSSQNRALSQTTDGAGVFPDAAKAGKWDNQGMLHAKSLVKNLGTTPILRGVDLTLRKGAVTGIISLEKIETRVLLSLLSGQEPPLSGVVEVPEGYVELIPGTSRLFGNLSILDNLAIGVLGAKARGIVPLEKVIAKVQPYVTDFGLERSLETLVANLRIPEQQLVSVILFLLQDAPILLLRDVLGNLTLDQYKLFIWKVKELAAAGRAIGIVPDNANQLFDFCDDVVLLRGGKSIFSSRLGEIDLEEVHNVLNNTEYMIRQSLENKFHAFQTTITEPEILYERSLKVFGNFCGLTQTFIHTHDAGGPGRIITSKYWSGQAPVPGDLARLPFTRTELQPGNARGAVLFVRNQDQLDFPFAEVVDLLKQTVDFLADRLKKEAEARERELQTVRLGREMDIARNIQSSILPRKATLPGYDMAALCETATEVGGDSWDLLTTPLGNFISVGDVSGHGLPSGIMALIEMAALHGVIQSQMLQNHAASPPAINPAHLYDMVNRVLCEINRDRIGSDKFMTKVLLIEKDGHFQHAGTHEIGLLYDHKTGAIVELDHMVDKTGFLGLSELIDSRLSLGQFSMTDGDFLLLYTDGLIEAKDAKDEQFGIERVKASLLRDPLRKPEKMLSDLRADLLTFAEHGDRAKHGGHLADDLTLVLLRRQSGAGA